MLTAIERDFECDRITWPTPSSPLSEDVSRKERDRVSAVPTHLTIFIRNRTGIPYGTHGSIVIGIRRLNGFDQLFPRVLREEQGFNLFHAWRGIFNGSTLIYTLSVLGMALGCHFESKTGSPSRTQFRSQT